MTYIFTEVTPDGSPLKIREKNEMAEPDLQFLSSPLNGSYAYNKWYETESLLKTFTIQNQEEVELEKLAWDKAKEIHGNIPREYTDPNVCDWHNRGFVSGYKAAQESHPFTKEQMIGFAQFLILLRYKNGKWHGDRNEEYTTEQLLEMCFPTYKVGDEIDGSMVEIVDEVNCVAKIVKP